ncbi:helix-turn-helix transcriptional regulator [Aliarcobacter butzleri]
MKKYIRAKDVAKKLDISIGTVWLYTKKNILPKPIKLSQRVTVWDEEEIDKLIEKKFK